MFERLIRQFPDFAQADEAYYQLFLTELAIEYYEKKGSSAEKYKAELIARFPESRYAKTLADPDSQRMPYMVNNVKIHSMSVLLGSISRWATQPLCGCRTSFFRNISIRATSPEVYVPRSRHPTAGRRNRKVPRHSERTCTAISAERNHRSGRPYTERRTGRTSVGP